MFISRNLMRDPNAAAGGGAVTPPAGGGAAPAFDPATFRQEIQESNRQMFETMQATLMNTVKSSMEGMFAAHAGNAGGADPEPGAADPVAGASKLKEQFANEMEALGLEDTQAAALQSFVTKIVGLLVPGFEKKITNTIQKNQNEREQQQLQNTRVAQQYPDVIVPGSPLRSHANDLFNRLGEDEKKSPGAMANCVREAASDLGIAPATKDQILTRQAPNATGDPITKGGDTKSTQAELDFAKAFGVSPEKYQEKVNILKMAGRR